jgi:hypothetical protein
VVAGFLIVVQLVLHVRGLRCPQGVAASDSQLDLVRLKVSVNHLLHFMRLLINELWGRLERVSHHLLHLLMLRFQLFASSQ